MPENDCEMLKEENNEIRELSVQLAKKLQRCNEEKEAVEKENERLTSEIDSTRALVHEMVSSMSATVDGVSKLNSILISSRPHQYQHLATPMKHSHKQPPPPHNEKLESKAQLISSLITSLNTVMSEAALNADTTYEILCHTHSGPLSEPELYKALQSKITYQKGKLEKQASLEMENSRLRRIIKARNSSDRRVETHDATCQADGGLLQYSPSRLQGGRITTSKPEVVKMPGAAEFNVNSELWPIRSIGIQCCIEETVQHSPPIHHDVVRLPTPTYDAFLSSQARSPIPAPRLASTSPVPVRLSRAALASRSPPAPARASHSPAVRRVRAITPRGVKSKKIL